MQQQRAEINETIYNALLNKPVNVIKEVKYFLVTDEDKENSKPRHVVNRLRNPTDYLDVAECAEVLVNSLDTHQTLARWAMYFVQSKPKKSRDVTDFLCAYTDMPKSQVSGVVSKFIQKGILINLTQKLNEEHSTLPLFPGTPQE